MNRPTRSRRRGRARRGGVYVLVLGVATVIAVVGLGAIAVSRSDIRSTLASRDWAAAGVLAESAIETVLARINTDPNWRTRYQSGSRELVASVGQREMSFVLVDPDGDLADGATEPVRIIGTAVVGRSVRSFSLEAAYRPPPVLDVLRFGLYAQHARTSGARVTGAPLGSPSLQNTGTLVADVRVGALANSGTIVGEVRTGEPPLSGFGTEALEAQRGGAVEIGFASLTAGEITRCVLSRAHNPYGSVSTNGMYFIRVPSGSTLRIRDCRIVASLFIELEKSAQFEVRDAVLWDGTGEDAPALVVTSTGAANVILSGTAGTLSESALGVNFNPPGTPYEGESDKDTSDTYPVELRGVFHIVGSDAPVQIGSGLGIVGTVICEGALQIGGNSTIRYDPQVLADPPSAYRAGDAGMSPVLGTWRWEVLP